MVYCAGKPIENLKLFYKSNNSTRYAQLNIKYVRPGAYDGLARF